MNHRREENKTGEKLRGGEGFKATQESFNSLSYFEMKQSGDKEDNVQNIA